MTLNAILLCVSLLFCFGTGIILFHRRSVTEMLVISICWFFCSYIFSTMILFLLNVYTLLRGLETVCFTDAVIFFITALTSEKIPVKTLKQGFRPERELKVFVIPLVIALIGLPFVSQKNELFGMGQDEGVYQCEAVNFINGCTERQQDFEEYHFLETDESRKNFETAVHNKLVGYDIPDENYPDTVYQRDVSPVSGIYHGIPTYPAVLAMWGSLFGTAHMADVQTVFYILMLFLVCLVCNNLKLNWCAVLIAGSITAFSPVIIWTAKSSLTEMFLSVLILLFLYFLTNRNYPEHYGFSLLPIMVFSCYHVSIYTLMPYVMLVYAGMYFFTKKKIFAGCLLCSVLEYLFSYLMMCHIQPFYTMNNYRFVFGHGINVQNITQAVLIISAVLLILCMLYILIIWKLKKTNSLKQFLENKKRLIFMQVFFICAMTAILIYLFCETLMNIESVQDIPSVTIIGFFMNTGCLLLTAGILAFFIKPETFLENEAKLIIFITCFYCMLVYSAFLRFQIEYYYYYARYLVPFIPCAVLFAVTALNQADKKLILPLSAVSLVLLFPYDNFLISHKDDTRMEWSILEDLTEQIPENSCVVIETDLLPVLWLPVRAVTGSAVYPAESNLQNQIKTLSEQYETLYLISETDRTCHLDENLEILYQNQIHRSEDENLGEHSGMPFQFSETESPVFLYQYLSAQNFYNAEDIQRFKLSGIDKTEHGYCWTVSPVSSLRCTLEKKPYTLHVKLGSEIPVPASGKTSFKIQLSINGISSGTEILSNKNMPEELHFTIPEAYVQDGFNLVSFQTDMWNASAINPDDSRNLGIPIESISFEERR